MMHKIFTLATMSFVFINAAYSQESGSGSSNSFAPDNAIVQTNIPFAIGAREARQELRGSFGWATFQEGLVDGVYFRFDPDGYARFAPTPRLDSDVFEVVCRPGTLNCMGRKGTISVFLNGQGNLQMQLDDSDEGDRLFIVEAVSELPLPQRVVGALDARMETLLSAGGELVVRRGDVQVSRTSLAGFGPVAAYLRWITAKQDYGVLPRDWPVPSIGIKTENSAVSSSFPTGDRSLQPLQVVAPTGDTQNGRVAEDVAEVRGELSVLRDLLVNRSDIQQKNDEDRFHLADANSSTQDLRIENLERNAKVILNEISNLRQTRNAPADKDPMSLKVPMENFGSINQSPKNDDVQESRRLHGASIDESSEVLQAKKIASQFEYLLVEIGLDPKTAFLILTEQLEAHERSDEIVLGGSVSASSKSSQEGDSLVFEILEDLRSQLPEIAEMDRADEPENSDDDKAYRSLTAYFRSEAE